MSDIVRQCVACGETRIRLLGDMIHRTGAVVLKEPGQLWECPSCEMMFRHPYLLAVQGAGAYADVAAEHWANPTRRPDFELAVKIITRSFRHGKVLDVGCFTGEMLAALPEALARYGIEPSQKARQVAAGRGIRLIGRSVESVQEEPPPFQAITMIDVIEHLQNPVPDLHRLTEWLAPDGMLLISTGNADFPLWRLMRLEYYYYYPEHVSFFRPAWFHWLGSKLGLAVESINLFAHGVGGPGLKTWQMAKALAFFLDRGLAAIPLVRSGRKHLFPFNRICRWMPPAVPAWPDHMMVVMRKRQPGTARGET